MKNVAATRALHSKQEKNSYRMELEGIYLGTKLAVEAGSTDQQWNFWTDIRAAITQCEKRHLTTNDMVAPESDVVLAIRYQLQKHGREGHFHHVWGHQNKERRFSEIDREARYNVPCDEYATKAASEQCKSELPYPRSKAMVSINGNWITSNIEQRLTEAAT